MITLLQEIRALKHVFLQAILFSDPFSVRRLSVSLRSFDERFPTISRERMLGLIARRNSIRNALSLRFSDRKKAA